MVKTEHLCVDNFDRKSLGIITKKESRTKSLPALRNPFLNFIREFRKNNTGMKSSEVVSKAAEKWRNMNQSEKSPYCEQAKNAPKRKRRKRTYSRKKRHRRN
ncbi:HMG box domain containing protein [Asbolus verrucosus]|uniref:HMG box domain containing protein n=1 Tax=Asbolus verrucosus TaxID=1661398 RepID=A0A482V8V0_ASBVE|nr:HMG box domain containing protein [Asbolus verrucosus]